MCVLYIYARSVSYEPVLDWYLPAETYNAHTRVNTTEHNTAKDHIERTVNSWQVSASVILFLVAV